MKKKTKDFEVNAYEFYGDNCLGDSVNRKGSGDRRPQGFVKIYEVDENGKKKLIGKHNLVLYQGREWLAQRIVNVNNSNVSSTKDEFLTWFGLGDGGVLPADPIDPIAPALTDTELSSLVMFSASDSSAADYHVIGGDYPETGYYKIPFDGVEFEQDSYNDDKWLVIKITTTVGVNYANGKQLSEAGLYTAASSAGGYSGQFTLFARVTYPSIIKSVDRRLIYTWFLYV